MAATQHPSTSARRLFSRKRASCRRAPQRPRSRPAQRLAGQKLASGFFRSRPAPRARKVAPQITGTHQESRSYRYVFAPGCVVAPNSVTVALGLAIAPAASSSTFLETAATTVVEAGSATAVKLLAGAAALLVPTPMGSDDQVTQNTKLFPVFNVYQSSTPAVYQLDQYAIEVRGQPFLLTRADPATTYLRRQDALQGFPLAPSGSGMSRDEYPFASTMQGGAGATRGYVPALENWTQGGQLSWFYTKNNIQPGSSFLVQTVPAPPRT